MTPVAARPHAPRRLRNSFALCLLTEASSSASSSSSIRPPAPARPLTESSTSLSRRNPQRHGAHRRSAHVRSAIPLRLLSHPDGGGGDGAEGACVQPRRAPGESSAAADLKIPCAPPVRMLPKSIQRVAAAAANASSSSAVVFAVVDDSASAAREASIPSCSSSNAASPVSSSETVISDDVDYSLHANIEAFFLSPKCMEYTMMEPCSAFFAPPLAMAMEMEEECCWEEEGDIALWSFSSLD